ncbi:hypothetical protein WG66_008909 [Moniliophthora roreri]|nr:hypothetical protein WG66_008909 [Moniliophthora roreri]
MPPVFVSLLWLPQMTRISRVVPERLSQDRVVYVFNYWEAACFLWGSHSYNYRDPALLIVSAPFHHTTSMLLIADNIDNGAVRSA